MFAGLIIRGFGRYSPALLLPLVILITADLVENLSQIALLSMSLLQLDDASLAAMAWVKAVASSSKFSMLYLTLGVVTLAVLGLAVRRVRALRKIEPQSTGATTVRTDAGAGVSETQHLFLRSSRLEH